MSKYLKANSGYPHRWKVRKWQSFHQDCAPTGAISNKIASILDLHKSTTGFPFSIFTLFLRLFMPQRCFLQRYLCTSAFKEILCKSRFLHTRLSGRPNKLTVFYMQFSCFWGKNWLCGELVFHHYLFVRACVSSSATYCYVVGDHSLNGQRLPDNLFVLAACNPLRTIDDPEYEARTNRRRKIYEVHVRYVKFCCIGCGCIVPLVCTAASREHEGKSLLHLKHKEIRHGKVPTCICRSIFGISEVYRLLVGLVSAFIFCLFTNTVPRFCSRTSIHHRNAQVSSRRSRHTSNLDVIASWSCLNDPKYYRLSSGIACNLSILWWGLTSLYVEPVATKYVELHVLTLS